MAEKSPISSYPKVLAAGHSRAYKLLDNPVTVQEKIDGSQISFTVMDGELEIRSRNVKVNPLDAGTFSLAVTSITERFEAGLLNPDNIYRGEYLQKPHHNAISYERVPKDHIILYDVQDRSSEEYYDPSIARMEADRIGYEFVPILVENESIAQSHFDQLMEISKASILGGESEGIVIKNYRQFDENTGKQLMGKKVRDSFKEKHIKEWGAANPSKKDILERLVEELAQPARFQKSVQHLADQGLLVGEPKDIGLLIPEVKKDIEEEEYEYIQEQLMQHFLPQLLRRIPAGFPNWYKQKLEDDMYGEGEE